MHTRRISPEEAKRPAGPRADVSTTSRARAVPRDPPPETTRKPFLEGPDLGVYRFSAYLNLGIIGIGMLLFGLVTMITHELADFDALTLFVAGATLASFAWQRTRAAMAADASS